MKNRCSYQKLEILDDEVKRSLQRTNEEMLLLQKMAQESMNRMSYFSNEVNEALQKTFIQRNEEIEQILKYRANQIDELHELKMKYYETTRSFFSSVESKLSVMPLWGNLLTDLADGLNMTIDLLVGHCERLAKAGWVIPSDMIPSEVADVLVQCNSKEEFDAYFLKLYTENSNENLESVFDSLINHHDTGKWKKLIEECIALYRLGYYIIQIPALLSVLEGVVAKLMDYNKTGIYKLCNITIDKLSSDPNSFNKLLWLSVMYFTRELYLTIDFDNGQSVMINRHSIMHGRDETSWQQVDAIRLFVALDVLLSMGQYNTFNENN